jgi:hypothetical protein
MRTSRRFQPTLNGLPSRIAPSAVAGVAAVAAVAVMPAVPIMGGGALAPITVTTADSDTAETGTSMPLILNPTPPPSATVLC